jgi:hypothetical protein
MKRLRMTTVLLVLLNVGLSACAALLWSKGQARVAEPERLNVPPLALPDLTVLDSVPMPSVDVTTIREQAAFYASRAFYRPPAAPAEIPMPQYEMAGTLRLADGKRIAFVRSKADRASRTLHVGDDLEGWRVQAIEPERIVLQRSEQTAELGSGRTTSTAGLIRGGMSVPRTAQTGIRVLGGGVAGAAALQTPTQGGAREARLYRPPPTAGK